MEVMTVGLSKDFEQSLLDYTGMLYAVAMRLTRNAVSAERLTERALLEALRSQDDIEPHTYIKAWLLTTLRNLFIADCRERTSRLISEEECCDVCEPDPFEGTEAEAEEEACLAAR